MRNVKNLTLCVVILIMVPFLGFASPSGSALAAVNTMDFELDWFDLETGTVIPVGPLDPPNPPTIECDFKFAYNSDREPHAVIFQNQVQGVEIAYSEEDYTDVTFSDVADLVFTPDLVDIPFDKVAVLLTTEGNYFKVGPISENNTDFTVTFEWEQLTSSPADLVEDLAQAVADLGLAQGVENGLNAKLAAAYKKLTDDNDKNDVAAINELGAFINAVEAQRGKKIAEADADALIALAQAIIDLLEAG